MGSFCPPPVVAKHLCRSPNWEIGANLATQKVDNQDTNLRAAQLANGETVCGLAPQLTSSRADRMANFAKST
jgi:hypothetical protein